MVTPASLFTPGSGLLDLNKSMRIGDGQRKQNRPCGISPLQLALVLVSWNRSAKRWSTTFG